MIRGAEATPDDAVVGGSLSIAEHARRVLEELPIGQPDGGPHAVGNRIGGDHGVGKGQHVAFVAVDSPRVGLSREDHHIGSHRGLISATRANADRSDRCALVDHSAEPFDLDRQTCSEASRVDRCSVSSHEPTADPDGVDDLAGGAGIEQRPRIPETVTDELCVMVPHPLPLTLIDREVDRSALVKAALDARTSDDRTDLVDASMHLPGHQLHRSRTTSPGNRSLGASVVADTPTTIATRGAEPDHLTIEHHHMHRRISAQQRVRKPQTREACADDHDIGNAIRRER